MSNSDLILELLDDIQPQKYCDDCLSNELKIQPRQQVNQICRRLEQQDVLSRKKAYCDSCQKQKITNVIAIASIASTTLPLRKALESQAVYIAGSISAAVTDIEQIRTQVVRICRQIWSKHKSEAAPHSISVVINALKNDSLLPSHQANMMLTLCGLRNVHVYENVEMGNREIIIASNALGIISDWWNKTNKQQ